MQDLFSLLAKVESGDRDTHEAEKEIASWGVSAIRPHLIAAGLARADLPNDAEIQAGILLALHSRRARRKPVDGPKKVQGLIEGHLYSDEAAEVQFRYAVKKASSIEVWTIRRHQGLRPVAVKDHVFSESEVPEGSLTHIPEIAEDESDVTAPGPGTPVTPIEIAARQNYRADIKLVFWIPYRGNNEKLSRKLPTASDWRTASMRQEIRMALRGMLATGNETPPDTFPTQDSWQTFVERNEYRGLLYRELFVCCPGENPQRDIDKLHKAGYTPPTSDADPDDLHEDHLDHQNDASMAEGLLLTPLGSLPNVPGIPDRLEDSIEKLRDIGGQSNESFSQGEEKLEVTPTAQCLSGKWDFAVRVGPKANVLFYLLTGKLVLFQGGELQWKLCCRDGKLQMSYKHSAIPSQRIYVNNQIVYEYDMLTATAAEVEASFEAPATFATYSTYDELEYALDQQTDAPRPKLSGPLEVTLQPNDGCPGSPPDDWLFEGAM